MNGFGMLIWLTQLGLNIAMPMVGCSLISVWLKEKYDLGVWVVFLGLAVGLIGSGKGLYTSLKQMERMGRGKKDNRGSVHDRK